MASTVPAKSNNPLHNFDLPHLKWKKNNHHNSNNNHHHHQRRRSTKLSSDSLSPSPQSQSQSQSPMRESLSAARHSPLYDSGSTVHHSPIRESLVTTRPSPMRESVVSVRRSPMRDSFAAVHRSPMRDSFAAVHRSPLRDSMPPRQSPMREFVPPPPPSSRQSPVLSESDKDRSLIDYRGHSRISSDKQKQAADVSGNKDSIRSKILIKIPRKNKADQENPEEQKVENESQPVDEEESVPKTWNLRPRKPIHKSLNLNGGGPFRASGSAMQEIKSQQWLNLKLPETTPESSNVSAQKKEKRQRFSIALSREEIDEDFYAMTGSKAPRRPKKRVKAVQKQLDTLFPGLWLASITPDSYKVCENPPKG